MVVHGHGQHRLTDADREVDALASDQRSQEIDDALDDALGRMSLAMQRQRACVETGLVQQAGDQVIHVAETMHDRS
jgi:hypothetical protein